MWERVELLMKKNNVRIADVARGSGISYSTLTDWKAGRYTPKNDKIIKIANFFHVAPEYITGETDDPDYYQQRFTIDVSDITNTIAEKYAQEHQERSYYLDDEVAKLAQELLENEEQHILMSAARGLKKEDILALADIAERMKRTNPEG